VAIAGSWLAGAVTPADYAGATRWGTGINPVHALYDSHKPGQTKEPLGSTADSGSPPEEILGPAMWGYSVEDAAVYGGEDYRYVDIDHPNRGESVVGRGDRGGPGAYALEVADFPAWGPHGADTEDPDAWQLPGHPGGARIRSDSHQAEDELVHMIAVPTRGVSGGWLNKAHGAVEEAQTSDPAQYEMTTSMQQLHRQFDNGRATGRGTDDPRTPIGNRLTGVKEKHYAMSVGMGGGPGAPDMAVLSTDSIPRRPWFYRSAGVPPAEDHTWNEITYFDPIGRELPSDAGDQVTTMETQILSDSSYGYAGGDYVA
jgi:hypothetical protein